MTDNGYPKRRRVRIVGDHPHRGESGTLTIDPAELRQGCCRWNSTRVEHGADGCYVRPGDFRPLARSEDPRRGDCGS
jgi:hypothetical protein